MDSQEAIELARKVLLEERTSPTVRYMLRAPVTTLSARTSHHSPDPVQLVSSVRPKSSNLRAKHHLGEAV